MKTKTFLIICLLYIIIGSVYSQNPEDEKNQIHIETGYAFTGSGDLDEV